MWLGLPEVGVVRKWVWFGGQKVGVVWKSGGTKWARFKILSISTISVPRNALI